MEKEEFKSLSEKIKGKDYCPSSNDKWFSEEDVREFIKLIKEFDWFIPTEEDWEDTIRRYERHIKKLAGDELV